MSGLDCGFQERCLVLWSGQQAIMALPAHVELADAVSIREQLLAVISRGAAVLVADMTATLSCDYAGTDALIRAYQRAVASGTELRLVVTAQVVRRALSICGLDRLVPVYATLEAALAAPAPGDALLLAAGHYPAM